jgi:hypothetical protein
MRFKYEYHFLTRHLIQLHDLCFCSNKLRRLHCQWSDHVNRHMRCRVCGFPNCFAGSMQPYRYKIQYSATSVPKCVPRSLQRPADGCSDQPKDGSQGRQLLHRGQLQYPDYHTCHILLRCQGTRASRRPCSFVEASPGSPGIGRVGVL